MKKALIFLLGFLLGFIVFRFVANMETTTALLISFLASLLTFVISPKKRNINE